MNLYRLFILDLQGNLVSGVDVRSADDDEALLWASYIITPDRVGEVWRGTRYVGQASAAHADKLAAETAVPCATSRSRAEVGMERQRAAA